MNSMYFLAAVLLSMLGAIESQSIVNPTLSANPCANKLNCGACIQTQSCAWCMDPEFGDRPRCFAHELKPATTCPEEFVVNPDNEQIMVKDDALSRGGVAISDGTIVSGGSMSGHESSSGSMSGNSQSSGGSNMQGSGSGQKSEDVVQISPQEVRLKLRISEFFTGKSPGKLQFPLF